MKLTSGQQQPLPRREGVIVRQLDLLDICAKEHRRLHRDLRRLMEEPRTGPVDVPGFASSVARHEAADRLLLHPLLLRDDRGRALVADRRAEQRLLAMRIRVLLETVPAEGLERITVAVTALERTLTGHTDREELEDFPHIRHLSTRAELIDLARVRRRLQRLAPDESESVDDVRPAADVDLGAIGVAEVVAQEALRDLDVGDAGRR